MQYAAVGTTGVEFSRVGLGGYELGPHPDEPRNVDGAVEVFRTAAEIGVNWVDTSENYDATANEALIGEALERADAPILVCTKVSPRPAITGGGSGFRPEQVKSAIRGSLQRLRRDHVDIFLLHFPDDLGVPLEDTWGAMAEIADEGLTRAVGMSNYEIDDISRCHTQRPVDVVQTGLNLIDYLEDRDLIRQCGELGIPVQIYEPLASGLLSDAPTEAVRDRWAALGWDQASFFRRLLAPGRIERTKAVVEGLAGVAERVGASAAQVAIAWVLRQPGVAATIAGSTNPKHLRSNAAAADLDVSTVLDELEQLIPLGPTFE